MQKHRYFRFLGEQYFLLHLPEERTVFLRGDKIWTDTKKGEKINLKHFKSFEIKNPEKEIIDTAEKLKQKTISNSLDYYKAIPVFGESKYPEFREIDRAIHNAFVIR